MEKPADTDVEIDFVKLAHRSATRQQTVKREPVEDTSHGTSKDIDLPRSFGTLQRSAIGKGDTIGRSIGVGVAALLRLHVRVSNVVNMD